MPQLQRFLLRPQPRQPVAWRHHFLRCGRTICFAHVRELLEIRLIFAKTPRIPANLTASSCNCNGYGRFEGNLQRVECRCPFFGCGCRITEILEGDFVMTCKGGALVIFCNRQLGFLQPLELITDARDELERFPVNHVDSDVLGKMATYNWYASENEGILCSTGLISGRAHLQQRSKLLLEEKQLNSSASLTNKKHLHHRLI